MDTVTSCWERYFKSKPKHLLIFISSPLFSHTLSDLVSHLSLCLHTEGGHYVSNRLWWLFLLLYCVYVFVLKDISFTYKLKLNTLQNNRNYTHAHDQNLHANSHPIQPQLKLVCANAMHLYLHISTADLNIKKIVQLY